MHVGSAPLSARPGKTSARWTGTRQVCNAYGITETGSWVAGLAHADVPAEDGLIGEGWGAVVIKVLRTGDTDRRPGAAAECAAGESGYVWLKTPALMKGYFQRDDLTAQAVVERLVLDRGHRRTSTSAAAFTCAAASATRSTRAA